MKIGVTVRPTQSVVAAAEAAKLAERLGFDGVWIADHYFHRDAAAALALMMAATDRITLGTAVVSPLLRHPALLASLAATLREIGPDRFVLGVGVGGYEFAGELDLATPKPLGVVAEATRIIRQLTSGVAEVSGEHFSAQGSQLRWAAADGPLYLAARGPKMIELAGRIADGVITHGIADSHIRFVRDRLADAPTPTALCLMLDVEINDSRTEALAALAPRCLTMAAGSFADALIPVYGLDPAQIAPARAKLRSGDRAGAAALVTPAMAEAFGVAGPPALVADRLRALADAGVDEVIVTVGGADAQSYSDQLTRLAEELHR